MLDVSLLGTGGMMPEGCIPREAELLQISVFHLQLSAAFIAHNLNQFSILSIPVLTHTFISLHAYNCHLGEAEGVEAYTLEVRVSNVAAIHLYEQCGFCPEGIRPGFYDRYWAACRCLHNLKELQCLRLFHGHIELLRQTVITVLT